MLHSRIGQAARQTWGSRPNGRRLRHAKGNPARMSNYYRSSVRRLYTVDSDPALCQAQVRRDSMQPFRYHVFVCDQQKPDSARSFWTCPHCGGPMIVLERLTPVQARLRSPPPTRAARR